MASKKERPRIHLRMVGSFVACNVCGEPGGDMRTYYSPRSIAQELNVPGWGTFVSGEHRACAGTVEAHGYQRHHGFPAWFPRVCGGCRWRACEEGRVAICTNPDRKEAGGAGLRTKRGASGDVVSCSGRAA